MNCMEFSWNWVTFEGNFKWVFRERDFLVTFGVGSVLKANGEEPWSAVLQVLDVSLTQHTWFKLMSHCAEPKLLDNFDFNQVCWSRETSRTWRTVALKEQGSPPCCRSNSGHPSSSLPLSLSQSFPPWGGCRPLHSALQTIADFNRISW